MSDRTLPVHAPHRLWQVWTRAAGGGLAELLRQGRLLKVPDSYTPIPEDQPGPLAGAIRQFIQATAEPSA
jgi:hypothetical protein